MIKDAKAATVSCRWPAVLCILISMRQLSFLMAGVLCAAMPASAQVTVDLHALDAQLQSTFDTAEFQNFGSGSQRGSSTF